MSLPNYLVGKSHDLSRDGDGTPSVAADLLNSDQKMQSHEGKSSGVLPEWKTWDTQQKSSDFEVIVAEE